MSTNTYFICCQGSISPLICLFSPPAIDLCTLLEVSSSFNREFAGAPAKLRNLWAAAAWKRATGSRRPCLHGRRCRCPCRVRRWPVVARRTATQSGSRSGPVFCSGRGGCCIDHRTAASSQPGMCTTATITSRAPWPARNRVAPLGTRCVCCNIGSKMEPLRLNKALGCPRVRAYDRSRSR
jgi:hypothetical protein